VLDFGFKEVIALFELYRHVIIVVHRGAIQGLSALSSGTGLAVSVHWLLVDFLMEFVFECRVQTQSRGDKVHSLEVSQVAEAGGEWLNEILGFHWILRL